MRHTLLIKNVCLDGKTTNILVTGNRFTNLNAPADAEAEKVIDASGKAILPPFFNTHTHAAMTLLRGYADDMALQKWLTEYIWPYEDKLTRDDIYRGSLLAGVEMIKSGTVFFSDMYFEIDKTIEAVRQLGMRAAIGVTMLDGHSLSLTEEKMDVLENWENPEDNKIILTVDPHAIYTASASRYQKCAELCQRKGFIMHTHLSETASEVADCIKAHGTTPVRYLDSLGVLGPNVVAAHCVHVDEEEWGILAKRGVTVAHCPCSNMKLSSGRFPYELAIKSGCRITLGTDGASSNNNLDLREEMKFAALLAKCSGDPELLPAEEVFRWATVNGAEAFGYDSGVIAEGKLADAVLVDMDNERMKPCHNLISNWVYSADSSCVDTMICDGQVIMENHHIPGEEEILSNI